MSNINDFVIDNGIFREYIGPNVEILEIPEGTMVIDQYSLRRSNLKGCNKIIFPKTLKNVGRCALDDYGENVHELEFLGDITVIGEHAFSFGRKLKKITFHGKVEKIEGGAFARAGILSIEFPKGVDTIGNAAFARCSELEEIHAPGLKKIGTDAFSGCSRLELVDIPENVVMGDCAFCKCNKLKKDGMIIVNNVLFELNDRKEIPDGIVTISKFALAPYEKIEIPMSVRTIHEQHWGAEFVFPQGFLQTNEKLSGKGLIEGIKNSKLTSADVAALYLFQSGKAYDEILKNRMDENISLLANEMAALVEKKGTAKHYLKAVEYVIGHVENIPRDIIQKLYDIGIAAKYKKEVALLNSYLQEDVSCEDEAESSECYSEINELKKIFNEHLLDKSIYKGFAEYFEEVRYAGSEELAPSFVVKCAIVPYLDQYEGRPKKIGEYNTDYIKVNFVEGAEKAAALLNRNDLMNLVEKAILNAGTSGWYIPYGRYADRNQISELISKMRKWESWRDYAATGRSNIIIARGALMLSDTREAMMNLDKTGHLGVYAALRNTDADALRDTVLAEFGLDEAGHKEYDLGGKKITVTLEEDLSLSIYDESAKKIVKSIPKKGAEPELYEKAKEDFAEMKKNVKKVVQGRVDLLFESFLTGAKRREPGSWINSYTKNPVLRQIASLIVWNQGDDTFIMTKDGAVTSDGAPYAFQENVKIGVAHPIEMKPDAVSSWQKYFTSRNLKQPFAQIWEPVLNPKEVTKDRYIGCMIPFYRFRGQKKHGIHVEDYDFHNEIDISFDDCRAEVERIDWNRHEINNEDRFEVKSIGFRTYTRQVNHILAYLDRITIYDRIKKDDITIEKYLPSFTLAQITEFIQIAAENNCTNVTSILLDYKNANYADFDPMEEFSLDF